MLRDDSGRTDIRKTRLDLRPALDYEFCCRERQNAFAICPNRLPLRVAARAFRCGNARFFAIVVSRAIAIGHRLTPAAPATWLRFGAFLDRACAQPSPIPAAVLIPTACRIFKTALWAPSRMKPDFRLTPCLQIDELADFRRFVLTGESGEAFTHARPVGCFRDRRLAPPKFLAPSAQPFEPGPGAFPLA